MTNFGIKKVCSRCEGAGHFVREPCTGCSGKGVIENSTVKEEFKIPKGVRDGQKLRFTHRGHGSKVFNAKPGDLVGVVKIKEHETYKRDGYDIISEVPITISQAILGGSLIVETVHGEKEITLDKGTGSDSTHIIKDHGAPHLPPEDHKNGDHIIKFKIIIPSDLSPRQIELIKQLKELEMA